MNLTLVKPCIDWCSKSVVSYNMQYIPLLLFSVLLLVVAMILILYAGKDDTVIRERRYLIKYAMNVIFMAAIVIMIFVIINNHRSDASISSNIKDMAARLPDDAVLYGEEMPDKWSNISQKEGYPTEEYHNTGNTVPHFS